MENNNDALDEEFSDLSANGAVNYSLPSYENEFSDLEDSADNFCLPPNEKYYPNFLVERFKLYKSGLKKNTR